MCKFFINLLFLNVLFVPLLANDWVNCEKEYVDASQIIINDNGIFIYIDDNLIQVKNIESEQNRFSFSTISKESIAKIPSWYWTCPKCGTKNSPFRKTCKNCNYRW